MFPFFPKVLASFGGGCCKAELFHATVGFPQMRDFFRDILDGTLTDLNDE